MMDLAGVGASLAFRPLLVRLVSVPVERLLLAFARVPARREAPNATFVCFA